MSAKKFTEEKLEQTVIDLFEAEGYQHQNCGHIYNKMVDVPNIKVKKDMSA